jgi:hypothetical protein
MKSLTENNWILPYIISNIVAFLFLWAAIKKPYLARLMFVFLFGWAAIVNYSISHDRPEVYLEYGNVSLKWYSNFIRGWFSRHIVEMVSLIALGQALIAVGMILKGWCVKLACAAAILFFLAIAPLGVYAAFPFSITASIAAYIITRKNACNYLWKFNHNRQYIFLHE